MAKFRVYNLGGINLKVSPLLHKPGQLVRCLNMENDVYGGKKKRPGYVTYLGTPDTDQVNSLFNYTDNTGTQFWNYRASGSALWYSTQGTGDWTICGNGTITDGYPVRHTVLEDTLVVAQEGGTVRHSTNGTSFTDTSSAPTNAIDVVEYQNRIWAAGTASDLFYSTTGTPSDWTSDSSSIAIPGAGKLNGIFKTADILTTNKNSGLIHQYDGYSLFDIATNRGFTSRESVAEIEGYKIGLNRYGFIGYGGDQPEILSHSIEKQIYNDAGNGIAGTTFDNAPGITHKYDYLCSVGTVKDDLTNEEVANCIEHLDFQSREWDNWKYYNRPTAWCSYKDASGDQQLIFGDASGQCYTYGGTATADNDNEIECVMEGLLHFGAPELDKKVNEIWAFANPGCKAKMQFSMASTFTKEYKNWIDLGDLKDGCLNVRFPEGTRDKLLFWKVYESSKDTRFHFYGFTVDAEVIGK